jgi:hypothetical protein
MRLQTHIYIYIHIQADFAVCRWVVRDTFVYLLQKRERFYTLQR